MVRDDAIHPRWMQRMAERQARRHNGDKVVRWIARPALMKERAKTDGLSVIGQDRGMPTEQARPTGTVRLRIVSDN